jgi:hypothetical protein
MMLRIFVLTHQENDITLADSDERDDFLNDRD